MGIAHWAAKSVSRTDWVTRSQEVGANLISHLLLTGVRNPTSGGAQGGGLPIFGVILSMQRP